MADKIRLDKFLADMGRGSRSEIREAARKGRILVNGEVCKKTDQKISVPGDTVVIDGEAVAYVKQEYYMLNKPQGVVSATEDGRYQTAVELIAERSRNDLFPVGRLDRDTEGLLLITNDGELAHRLLSPKKHVDKTYFARCAGRPAANAVELIEKGLVLSDGLCCLPAKLEIKDFDEATQTTEIYLTIHEGKFHQVKRMMEAVGSPVVYLKRLRMGALRLDETLKPGEYRTLTEQELTQIKN